MYDGKLVRLRDLRLADAETCLKWVNDLDTARKCGGGAQMPYTIENERDFIANFAGRKPDQYHFGVETRDGHFVGVCSYTQVDWKNRNCVIGWFIGDTAMRGRGLGTDMIKTLLKICFHELDMHKVYLEAYEFNQGALRLYERMGFVLEAVYRKRAYSMGRRWDEMHYSMLRSEYEARYGGEGDV